VAYALASVARGRPVRTVCEVLGVARSNIMTMRSRAPDWSDRRRAAKSPAADAEVVSEVKAVITSRPSYRYIRVWGIVHNARRSQGRSAVNGKRIYQIMRDNKLLLPQRNLRRNDTRAHDGRVAVDASDIRWCSDGFEITCWNKERVRVDFTQDCCDREAIGWVATTRGIDSILVKDMLITAIEQRFGQIYAVPRAIEFLTDNGSYYTAKEVRDLAKSLNIKPVTTPIES